MPRSLNGSVVRLVAPGLAAAVVAGAGLTACSRSASPRQTQAAASASASSSAAPSPSSSAHGHASGKTGATTAAVSTASDAGPAAGCRLQALLAQHTVLAADMMRARVRRDPDFAQAAEAALTRNTQALSTLVGSLFGADAAAAFATRWSGHVANLFDYAEARRAKDAAGLERSRAQLVKAEQELASFFAGASKGRLTPAAAVEGVKMHVDQLLAQADAYASGDYAAAAVAYTKGYEHAFMLGGALAQALLPAEDAAALGKPGWQLRVNMTQLLGEHVALVVAAMRAASGPATADFQSIGNALNRNTQSLSGAVGTLFGAPAASTFQSLWADHVDALMTVTAGAARDDNAAQQDGRRRLKAFEPALATFLAGATQSRLGADALAHAYAEHDAMLLGEIEAYQAKDYTKAHDLGYQAYDEMFDLAGQLSHAIELTLAKKLPKGGSKTGAGGMAAVVGGR
jgi:hypothetical protein